MKYTNATQETIRVIVGREACFIRPGQSREFTEAEEKSPTVSNAIKAKILVPSPSPTTSKSKE